MWINLVLAVSSALAGFALWARPGVVGAVAVGFVALSGWQLFSTISHVRRSPVILRLGGFRWTQEDFCRGWLITGETGSGKTLAGINAMLWQVTRNCPHWGGVCIDDKGLYWETLVEMMRHFGRSDDLILLKVRPAEEPSNWKPPHTLNVLDYQGLPYSAKAKAVCDVAASLGQGGDQSFFRAQAVLWMEFAFRCLACADLPVTLDDSYDFLSSEEEILEVMSRVAEKRGQPEADALIQQFLGDFLEQPKEQLGGTKATLANRLKYFTDRDLGAVFCPKKSSVDFRDIDRGKIICVAIPQRYQAERRYLLVIDSLKNPTLKTGGERAWSFGDRQLPGNSFADHG